ncbi:MAG: SIR2 family protein [Rhodobacteraceae bacterium]|nr:SIR2 family protein [Paracoccaceae bacterium]
MSAERLFISYSHEDTQWLKRVLPHLAILNAQGSVGVWADKELQPGDRWEDEINAAMRDAEVAVLLVSVDFLNSEFIKKHELPTLLAIINGEQQGRLRRIVPLLVRHCNWESVPELKQLEMRPKFQGKVEALQGLDEHLRDVHLTEFAEQVSKILFDQPKSGEKAASAAGGAPVAIIGSRDYATLELRISHCAWNSYRVELCFTWSGDRTRDFVCRYGVCLDLDVFATIDDSDVYALELRKALFPNLENWRAVTLAKARADEKKVVLRVRICIDRSARELHSLNWEKLTVWGGAENPLALASVAFARYALGYGGGSRATLVRRNAEPRALLLGATVAPAVASRMEAIETLDVVAQVFSAAGIHCTVEQHWHAVSDLREALRKHQEVDYLYLLVRDCPPGPQGALLCNPNSGGCGPTDCTRNALSDALDVMERLPRLIVVAPVPESTKATVPAQPWSWLVHLAQEIVERGVLGVVTLQDAMEPATWHGFLARFFAELMAHGQADHAARAAREQIAGLIAAWAPVVVTRMRSARLWYEPHLMDETRRDQTWDLLISRVADGRCTPIIGPGVDYRIARFRQHIAQDWAERYQYPLAMHEQLSLPQVAQYVAATRGDAHLEAAFSKDLSDFALQRYGHLLKGFERAEPLAKMLSLIAGKVMLAEPDDPHVVLASLPFATYVTANFNNFLAEALRRSEPARLPVELVFNAEGSPVAAAEIAAPSAEHPLVYHLFGRLDDLESLVLTEDDYFDFLIDFWREHERVPTAVRAALASSSLLFLGFNLNQWDFRVLFRSLLKGAGNQKRRKQLHVAVQVDPDDEQITDPDRAREYLEQYFEGFSESEVSIYWGSSEDFLTELQRRWRERGS